LNCERTSKLSSWGVRCLGFFRTWCAATLWRIHAIWSEWCDLPWTTEHEHEWCLPAHQVRPSKVLGWGMSHHLQERCTGQCHFHIASPGSGQNGAIYPGQLNMNMNGVSQYPTMSPQVASNGFIYRSVVLGSTISILHPRVVGVELRANLKAVIMGRRKIEWL
jgi:hypothetical protein